MLVFGALRTTNLIFLTGNKASRRPKRGEVLWTENDDNDDDVVYSGTVTLQGGRNRPPTPSYGSVDSNYHHNAYAYEDRSMYGDDMVYDEEVFAARDNTVDRHRAHRGRAAVMVAPLSGKVQGPASVSVSIFSLSLRNQ